MKFTNGNWLLREGVKAHYATQVVETRISESQVQLLVACTQIRHRGDTLQGPLLTITLTSPVEGVLSVRIQHYAGGADGSRFVVPAPLPMSVTESADHIEVSSGSLAARITKESWSIQFLTDGKPTTTNPSRGLGLMLDGDKPFIMNQLGLGVGELVYGLGERFTAFVKNGQVVDMWNEDGGTCSDQAYKNIPLYLTNRGYGVFVNHSGRVSFEVASERSSRVQFSVPGEALEYWVIAGPTPKEVLTRYTGLLGRPALPPKWSFGLWLSTSFTTDYDEATVNQFVDGMAERGIPLSVFHYDCFWMKAFHWCDFEWDPAVFPDPVGMLQRLHEKGLKVSVWINPYIAQASPLFAVGASKGYFLKRPDGSVWQWDMWQPGMAIVDFTNPEAVKWFQSHLERLVDMGVDALKTDFGERIPLDVVYFDGSDPLLMHNKYTQLYNQAVFDVLERKKGVGEAVLFARSATAGGQQLPVHWGGDCWSDFEAMAESLRGGLSLGLGGFGFWSHDIGGFEGKPPLELYCRWVAFGLLSSHSRLHGSGSYRVPWQYDDPVATDCLRHFALLKQRLMPYLWSQAQIAREQGIPMMRAMHLEFPDDPACDTLDRQYMLGESLLVAPVFDPEGWVSYYVPEGTWTSLLGGEDVVGPKWVREQHDVLSLPVLKRPGHRVLMSDESV